MRPVYPIRSGMDILHERAAKAGVTLGDSIPVEVIESLGIPVIVACSGCGMTMAGPAAGVDADGYTWCQDCAPPAAAEGVK